MIKTIAEISDSQQYMIIPVYFPCNYTKKAILLVSCILDVHTRSSLRKGLSSRWKGASSSFPSDGTRFRYVAIARRALSLLSENTIIYQLITINDNRLIFADLKLSFFHLENSLRYCSEILQLDNDSTDLELSVFF